MMLPGCAGMLPDVANIVGDICDTAIEVEVNKEAIQEDTDVHITIDVINKNPPKPQP
jgi:hypothetical protein